jgi:hypothetical protein
MIYLDFYPDFDNVEHYAKDKHVLFIFRHLFLNNIRLNNKAVGYIIVVIPVRLGNFF